MEGRKNAKKTIIKERKNPDPGHGEVVEEEKKKQGR